MAKKSKSNNVWQAQAGFYKRKMIMSRTIGILCCLIAIASIALYYFKVTNEWMNLVTIAYCAGMAFTANSFLQDIKVGNPWQRINGACSIILFLFALFLIVWGFIHGHLTLQF